MKQLKSINPFHLALLCFLYGSCNIVLAQKSIAELTAGKAISVQSQRLQIERQQNRITYLGQVVARQGKLRIRADKLIISSNAEDKITRLHATSEQANQVFMNSDYVDNQLNATATEVIYLPPSDDLVLRGNPAKLSQPKQRIEALSIDINLRSENINAQGSTDKPAFIEVYNDSARAQ